MLTLFVIFFRLLEVLLCCAVLPLEAWILKNDFPKPVDWLYYFIFLRLFSVDSFKKKIFYLLSSLLFRCFSKYHSKDHVYFHTQMSFSLHSQGLKNLTFNFYYILISFIVFFLLIFWKKKASDNVYILFTDKKSKQIFELNTLNYFFGNEEK